jgi:hypothetical protein
VPIKNRLVAFSPVFLCVKLSTDNFTW